MQFTQLDALTYVGKQISVANLNDLKRMNFKTVIVARPEGEAADQPTISELRDAAEALGITVHQIPVVPGNIADADVFGHFVLSYQRRIIQFLPTAIAECARHRFGR